ncbi:MAG: hypothetical protein GKR94_00880 [Gammaproteobacteria bacterium]|nr:hypothetical protein [Gammaproteobacteria bacterium]
MAEAEHVKSLYPNATRIGIAEGASDNWPLLTPLTQHRILDVYHATQYLAQAANGAHQDKTGKSKRKAWLKEQCHRLKHQSNGAQKVLDELKGTSNNPHSAIFRSIKSTTYASAKRETRNF